MRSDEWSDLFEAYSSYLRSSSLADDTISQYESHFDNFLDWFVDVTADHPDVQHPFDLTPGTIKRHLMDMASDGYAPQTVKGRMMAVSKFYNASSMIAADQTSPVLREVKPEEVSNPINDLDTADLELNASKRTAELGDEVPNFIEPDEKEQLVENVKWPETRNQLLIRLLWQTGMRAHEASKIRIDEDLDIEDKRIRVRSDKSGERVVFYQSNLSALMNLWLEVERPGFKTAEGSPYLFISQKSGQLSADQVNTVVRDAAERAGLQEIEYHDQMGRPKHAIHAHVLRHSFAVQALRNDWNLEYLRRAMGHEDLETTKVYMDALEKDIRDEFRAKGPGIERSE